jgi:tetratricopeptide (TPR) repeat protein
MYASAERLWLDNVQQRPANPRARVAYAIELLASRRYPEAEAQLTTALALDDTNALAHLNLGTALVTQGRPDDGIAHLERALALDPAANETLGMLGEAYLDKGQAATAMAYFDRAIASFNDSRAARFLLNRAAFLYATLPDDGVRNGAKAVELAERAVRSYGGTDLTILETLGAAYAEAGRFADASRVAREAVAIARAAGDAAAQAGLERQLALYEAGRTLRSALKR